MKANELKELLAKEARGVCLELLGRSGKIEGGEFVVGDIHGSPGKSLKVRLTGSKAGVWCDFAAGMGGDLIDLAMATRSYTLSQACRWAENYLHIPSDYQDKRPVAIKPKATYTRAAVPKVTLFPDAVKQYLVDERKITEETLRTFGIYGEGENMCFPSYVDDVCYMIKYISIHRDEKGHKKISTSANSEPCLFGWQALTGKEREIIICEGEIDCMSWHQYGHAALSVPRGAGEGNQVSWIEAEYDNLARFDTIYLSFDDDEVGHKCTNEVLNRLGKERCKIIELPFKDCNELLKKGYWKEHIDQIVAKATYRDPVELKQLSNYRDKAYLVAHPELVEDKGIKLEIGNDVGMHFKASEVTLWSGINGHGKSMVLNQLMLDTIRQGKDICIASLEVKPEVMLAKMVRQASGCRCPSDEEFHRIVDWLGNKICVFDFVGETSHVKLLETFEYAYKRYGITVFIIDSMMLLDIKEEDRDAQKMFAQKVCKFANDFSVHVHLVAHPRKTRSEEEIPGKMDISGSGMIGNAVSNIIIVWRNKKKETLLNKHSCGQTTTAEELEVPYLRGAADTLLICVKNRNGEWEGAIPLWFHRESMQFLPYMCAEAKKYLLPTLP